MTGTALMERRRPAFDAEFLARVGIAWAMIAALLVATGFAFIRDEILAGPDDALRLVQVRDLIAGQSWFDLTQYRIDAPAGGVPMHWSRLVDIPLLLVIVILTPITGAAAAEAVALVTVPLITLFAAILLAARITWRLFGMQLVTLASMALALSVPVLSQMRPMAIDHHGWQIVLALVAANGMLARNPRIGGAVVGLALATWLAISVEGLPMAVAFCGLLALRWLCNRREADGFASCMTALALGSVALFMLMRGTGDLAPHCDAISPWHIGVFCFVALGTLVLRRMEPLPRAVLVAGLGIFAAGGVAFMMLAAPQCATGGFAATDPLVARVWLANVAEGQPLWRQGWKEILQVVVPAAIALAGSLRLALRHGGWLRRFWFEYAALIVAAIGVTAFVARGGGVVGALAAAPLAWQIDQWLRAARRTRSDRKQVPSMALIAGMVIAPLAIGLLLRGHRAEAVDDTGTPPQVMQRISDCRIADAGAVLSALPRGEIFAPLDAGPAILLASPHTVVASGHHRADAAIRFTIETLTGTPQVAQQALAKRGTSYVVHCPGLAETAMLAMQKPDSFAAALERGEGAPWLEPVQDDAHSPIRIWRVRD